MVYDISKFTTKQRKWPNTSTGATTTVASSTAGAITNVLQAPLLETQFTLLLSQSALE